MRAMAVGCSCTSLDRMSSMLLAAWLSSPRSKLFFRKGRITCKRTTRASEKS